MKEQQWGSCGIAALMAARDKSKKTNIPLDGSKTRVTQYNKVNNTRVSWTADGKTKNSAHNQHRTDQNVKKGRSGRH